MPSSPTRNGDERYIVISADCHGGGNIGDYRPYLDAQWRDEFDAWAAAFEMPYEDLKGDNGARNWDSDRRRRDLEADGQVAEIIFPEHRAAVLPEDVVDDAAAGDHARPTCSVGGPVCRRTTVGSSTSVPMLRAGAPASCRSPCTTSRRRWPRSAGRTSAGLRGGVLLPGTPPGLGLPQLFDPCYDPLWQVCEELAMPVNHHTGSASPSMGPTDVDTVDLPARGVVVRAPRAHASHRRRRARTVSRSMQLVFTEQGTAWVPEELHEARLLLRPHGQRRRLARTGLGSLGGRAVVA